MNRGRTTLLFSSCLFADKFSSSKVFDKDSLTGIDPKYRQALALDPSRFATEFAQANHAILAEVEKICSLDPGTVTAKLYKLNVHQPGDFCKPHLDTYRAGNAFGTLVQSLLLSPELKQGNM